MLLIISLKFQGSFVSIKEINLLYNMRYFFLGFHLLFVVCLLYMEI